LSCVGSMNCLGVLRLCAARSARDDRFLKGGVGLEGFDGCGAEGAAEVGAAEVFFAVACGAAEGEWREAAGVKATFEEWNIERGMDGVAGEGVVELEAKMLVRGDGLAGVGLIPEMQRKAGSRGRECGRPGWSRTGH